MFLLEAEENFAWIPKVVLITFQSPVRISQIRVIHGFQVVLWQEDAEFSPLHSWGERKTTLIKPTGIGMVPQPLNWKTLCGHKSWDQGFSEIISRKTSAETSVAAVKGEQLSGGRRPNHTSSSSISR